MGDSVASRSAPTQDPTGPASPAPDPDVEATRASLFRYLVSDNASEYRAVMTLFAGALLVDLSAADAAAALHATGSRLTADEVAARCAQLEEWGNLVRGVRDARVPSVRDYLRSRARYQGWSGDPR